MNISGRDRYIENRNKTRSTTTPSTLGEKNLVNFGQKTTEIQWCILTHPNGFFSGDYISALKGCCPFKFLHMLQIDPGYPAHPPSGTGVPPKNINGENLKCDLKFRVCAPITSGPVVVSSRNFFQTTCCEVGVIMWVQLLEGPPLNFGRAKKPSKFRHDF